MKTLGARYLGNKTCLFRLWAPFQPEVSLFLPEQQRIIPMQEYERGYFQTIIDDVPPGIKYLYLLGDKERPDPASYYQPDDVLGASAVVDHLSFPWTDAAWSPKALKDMIIYEIHIGTFTAHGTFEAAIERLDDLVTLGITAIEIMPVAQFSGNRNWGYDGTYPYAVQNSYGGPDGFKKLIDACHAKGLAVILDVVYNHVGPEGNFLAEFMPSFTDKYQTPWGKAINYDDQNSEGVREFFIQNALYWFKQYHIDALRLDAIHGIYDQGPKHFLKELSERVARLSQEEKRRYYLIAESDLNDRRIILPASEEGYGIDSQWSDDFHHSIHAFLTKEKHGYYEDFGELEQIAKAFKKGFVYSGQHSRFRHAPHGTPSEDLPAETMVVSIQNHDQIGNRLKGERLSTLVSFEALKLAAAALMLSAYIPLLFMGEEYGEENPFLYFMSFYDKGLIEAVRKGRKKEFESFNWKEEPVDPYATETFKRSILDWQKREKGKHKILLDFYKKLITLRKHLLDLGLLDKKNLKVDIEDGVLIAAYEANGRVIYVLMNFQERSASLKIQKLGDSSAHQLLNSADKMWGSAFDALPETITVQTELNLSATSVLVYEVSL